MSKYSKVFVIMVLVFALFSTVAFAAGNVNISVSNAGPDKEKDWQSTGSTSAEGSNWDIRIDSITNHGVGRVFLTPSYNWGSGLYTYGPSTTGWRPVKKYDRASSGNLIVWRMRQDDDYTGAFSCTGIFRP